MITENTYDVEHDFKYVCVYVWSCTVIFFSGKCVCNNRAFVILRFIICVNTYNGKRDKICTYIIVSFYPSLQCTCVCYKCVALYFIS